MNLWEVIGFYDDSRNWCWGNAPPLGNPTSLWRQSIIHGSKEITISIALLSHLQLFDFKLYQRISVGSLVVVDHERDTISSKLINTLLCRVGWRHILSGCARNHNVCVRNWIIKRPICYRRLLGETGLYWVWVFPCPNAATVHCFITKVHWLGIVIRSQLDPSLCSQSKKRFQFQQAVCTIIISNNVHASQYDKLLLGLTQRKSWYYTAHSHIPTIQASNCMNRTKHTQFYAPLPNMSSRLT